MSWQLETISLPQCETFPQIPQLIDTKYEKIRMIPGEFDVPAWLNDRQCTQYPPASLRVDSARKAVNGPDIDSIACLN
jgi:hypothetical protein